MSTYAFRGNERLIDSISDRLSDAGFVRQDEIDGADVVITYFSSMTALEDAYFGDGGLIQMMVKDSLAVDLSPTSTSFATELAAVATVNDIDFVTAAMVVKNKVAEDVFAKENLACIAASEGDGFNIARDLIDAIFGDVREVASAKGAQLVRAVSTVQNASDIVSAVETLSLFESIGNVDIDDNVKSMITESATPATLSVIKAVLDKRFEGAYTVEMLMGELSAAMMCADDVEIILPQTEAVFHLFELLAIVGGIDLSPAALSLVYEGDSSESAKKYGLDWQRMESIYDSSSDGEDLMDSEYDDSDFDDYEDDFSDFNDYGEAVDDTNSGFGYSVN